jgi:hypothetical protein
LPIRAFCQPAGEDLTKPFAESEPAAGKYFLAEMAKLSKGYSKLKGQAKVENDRRFLVLHLFAHFNRITRGALGQQFLIENAIAWIEADGSGARTANAGKVQMKFTSKHSQARMPANRG